MKSQTEWRMLKDALLEKLDALDGYWVTHALFTSYAFEPDFFETAVMPLLLPDHGADLSAHPVVRRFLMEKLLRRSPIKVDVFFDARVVVPGCPWLPYVVHPVKLAAEFHGKVIVLLLEDKDGHRLCLLGAGSANLTQKGWWDNVEGWYFAEPFDPSRPPGELYGGLVSLLRFLIGLSPRSATLEAIDAALDGGNVQPSAPGAPVFGVFYPGGNRFLPWLEKGISKKRGAAALEIISPYFAEDRHKTLVKRFRAATGTDHIHVWLPEDPWQAGGKAALIEEDSYRALAKVKVRWCRFLEPGLSKSREVDQRPRFAHVKVIRRPGCFSFMGSVNFSNNAIDKNFEAGFRFPDRGAAWLQPIDEEPARFLAPEADRRHAPADLSGMTVSAIFDWRSHKLAFDFGAPQERTLVAGHAAEVFDALGQTTEVKFRVPDEGEQVVDARGHTAVGQSLQQCAWLKVQLDDGRAGIAWVQQNNLEWRPLPEVLTPSAWRILEMWQGLANGSAWSLPGVFDDQEVVLDRQEGIGEAPPAVEPEREVIEEIARAHGSLYSLRKLLQHEASKGRAGSVAYYFSAQRPDTLPALLDRLAEASGKPGSDVIATWSILSWAEQIAMDHKDDNAECLGCPEAGVVGRRARQMIDQLARDSGLNQLEAEYLAFAGEMFLRAPRGKDSS